jgi:hypothetical protein
MASAQPDGGTHGMSNFVPTAADERWRVLAERYPSLQSLVRTDQHATNWKYASLLTRCLFFVLGLFVAGLVYSVFNLIGLPAPGFIAAAILIGAAEWLIQRKHLFASGIEESLWVAGLMMLVFELLSVGAYSNATLGFSLAAVALGLAGWRLLNPLFTTLAVAAASAALAFGSSHNWNFQLAPSAGYYCFALGLLALAAGSYTFARPSHDRMLDWLVVAMPLFGFFWLLWQRTAPLTLALLPQASLAMLLPVLLVFGYGCAAILVGLQRRQHAPLIAALVCIVLLAYELRALTGLALQWRLIMWGLLGLVTALLVERLLRTPRRGITSQDIEEPNPALQLAQLGSTTLATATANDAAAGTAPEKGVDGQGGGFGGGGASGRF